MTGCSSIQEVADLDAAGPGPPRGRSLRAHRERPAGHPPHPVQARARRGRRHRRDDPSRRGEAASPWSGEARRPALARSRRKYDDEASPRAGPGASGWRGAGRGHLTRQEGPHHGDRAHHRGAVDRACGRQAARALPDAAAGARGGRAAAGDLGGRAPLHLPASLHGLDVRLGGYVVLEHDGTDRLGQLLSLELGRRERDRGRPRSGRGRDGARRPQRRDDPARARRGRGPRGGRRPVPRRDHAARRRWRRCARGASGPPAARARLEIGELALAPGAPCRLDAGGFDRHTFLCGQSGSGKTYSLGVVLERLLMETELRDRDPGPQLRLRPPVGEIRAGADPALAERYRPAAERVSVHSSGAEGAQRLRLRIAELEPAAQAALLRLDPIADREEHSELAAVLAAGRPPHRGGAARGGAPGGAARWRMRVQSLGVEAYGLWARDQAGSVLDAVRDPAARCVVVDLGSLPTREEQALASAAVLGELWRRRAEREPVLIVIDEAHNVCPARAGGPADRAGHRPRRPDRRRGPQVRPLPARLDPAPAEGARERHQPVRQPACSCA